MTARIVRGSVLVPLVVVVLALVADLAARPSTTSPASDKSIFVAALDESGKPVPGLVADDFRLREDGADREIIEVKPATQTPNIVFLADSTQSIEPILQDFRKAIFAFMQQVRAVSPEAQISLMEFGQAAVTMVPFTSTNADLEKGINRIVAKPTPDAVLLEAIIDASNSLAKRPSPRRAIVSLNVEPGTERSRDNQKTVGESLKKSVAQLWALTFQNGGLKNPSHDLILGQLAKNTGGNHEVIVGNSGMETWLKTYADAITMQYEVTYKRPGSSAQVVQVGTVRQGIKLHASGYAPQ